MGIVFVFGAVFGTVYVIATQTKVSDIENKFNNEIDSNRYIEVFSGGIFKNSFQRPL